MNLISKEKLKGFFSGILLSTGVWMWVINFSDYLLKVSPIKNQYIIGAILVLMGWFVSGVKIK